MPSAKYLSDPEMAVIDQLLSLELSNCEIARRINRSEGVIRNYIKKGSNYGKKKKTKGNQKLSNRQKNQIYSLASGGKHSAQEIATELNLDVTPRRIQQLLNASGRFKYVKKARKPFLKPVHINARLQWAREHIHWTTEWTRVVFSDEKKFNLDGPDGFSYYWHDLRKEKEVNLSRNFGGGSLMVWAGFSMNGKTPLIKISTRMNSENYVGMLEDILINFSDDFMDGDFIFMQDNAAIHVSRYSKAWFEAKEIELLKWPACSPDLNPIENLWGILGRKVYRGNRKFLSLQELEQAVRLNWMEIDRKLLESLINSMPGRVFDVVARNGKQIDK